MLDSTTRRRLLPCLAMALAVNLGGVIVAHADSSYPDSLDASVTAPPDVGTVDEYIDQRGSFMRGAPRPAHIPMLGVTVFRNRGKLTSGEELDGLAVADIDRHSPAYDAGLRGERIKAAVAAKEVGAAALVLGAAAFFPPVLFAVPMLSQMSSPRTYDVIIAIDAERIEDVNELEQCLRKASAGETIYMTIIRDGRRMQLRVAVPAVVSVSSDLMPRR